MKLRNAFSTICLALCGLTAFAQDMPKIEVAVDYSYARFSPSHAYVNNSFSLNGAGGSVDFNFSKFIGIKADFQGYGSNTQNFSIPPGGICPFGCNGNVQANLFTYLFGPQVGLRSGKFRPFAHVLVGGAHSNLAGNLSSQGVAIRPSNNAFALAFGGGIDIPITHSGRVAFRPAEVDYLWTRFNIQTGQSSQSNFQYKAGVVLNF